MPERPRRFSRATPAGAALPPLLATHKPYDVQPRQPLPKPPGSPPYRLDLAKVIGSQAIAKIQAAGRIAFHVVGDTGGVASPQSQHLVTAKMVEDSSTSFLYILGDVVYYYGQTADYFQQFYDAYEHYPGPIFAIPGNHDGEVLAGHAPSLTAFVQNFCARRPSLTREAGDSGRDAMTQPNVYWTLLAPFVTIIGLYTNVPEGGWLDRAQLSWLRSELRAAPQDAALILTLHHPLFSWDLFHHGSQYLLELIDAATTKTRVPDLVLAGHVHNYQRFTRHSDSRPFIVCGAGGYWRLHTLPAVDGKPPMVPFAPPGVDARLDAYCDDHHGFLRIEVAPSTLDVRYFSVPRPQEPWRTPVNQVDSLVISLPAAPKKHLLDAARSSLDNFSTGSIIAG